MQKRGLHCLLAIAFTLLTPPLARAQTAADCATAARAAERSFALPQGLLRAVGEVETGRWDPRLDHVVAWPWSVDSAGQGQWYDSKARAVAAVRALQAAGQRNIDVGCFQISLLHHPDAFVSLDQAFDPSANADYAAHLLTQLHAMLGTWPDAVAAYHSADPQRGTPYRRKVLAAWSGVWPESTGGIIQFSAFGVHVWSPAAAGPGPAVIMIRAPSPAALPRVITPTR